MTAVLVDRKIKVWDKVHSHLKILSIREKDIRFFFSSPYRIGLIILFTVLFLPHAFVMVEDISLVGAYEVDPGSIVDTIESLYQADRFYNMNSPYHSRFYGWTYYWINFILVAPAYVLTALNVLQGYFFFLVSIRFVLFLIGLASLLAFFELARRFLQHNLFAFFAGLLYIASPVTSQFFYFIHPETTGLLFLFLALLCLFNFNEAGARDSRWYTFALLFLTLAVLSKHVFIFTALPVFFLFLYSYCYHNNISVFRFVLSRQFVRVLLPSLTFSVFIFFIINPFAFFQFRVFLANKIRLFSTQTQGSLSEIEAMQAWLDIIEKMPVLWISILLAPLSWLGTILYSHRNMNRIIYLTNLMGSIFFLFFSVLSLRYIIYDGYLAPIYPLFILNLLAIVLCILRRWNARPLRFVMILTFAYFLFFVLVKDFSVSLADGWDRLQYQESPAYKSYQYIEAKIPAGKKIAHDHFVAVPRDKELIGCHYWTGGCGTDYIEEFHPDYVIFDRKWTFYGVDVPQKAILINYINDQNFVLVDTIDVSTYEGSSLLEIWKEP